MIPKQDVSVDKPLPTAASTGVNLEALLKSGSTAFALAAVVAFISGFIIRFIYLEAFGINDLGSEAFRIKHIYVGILSLLFPICIVVPATLYIARLRDRRKERQAIESGEEPEIVTPASRQAELKLEVRFYSVILNCYLCFIFYVSILFVPLRVVQDRAELFLFVIVTLCTPVVVDWFARLHRSKRIREDIRTTIRWSFFVISALGLTGAIVGPISKRLWSIFLDGGWFYVAFVCFIPLLLSRANIRSHLHRDRKNKQRLRITMLLASVMLYFSGLITFALYIFPYIPSTRGGGNFEDAPYIKIFFKASSVSANPTEAQKAAIAACDSLVLIERAGKSLYLADSKDGGPANWAKLRALPQIIELNADSVEITLIRRSKHRQ
jgi:hypothetical protein